MDDYISKPINLNLLEEKVKEFSSSTLLMEPMTPAPVKDATANKNELYDLSDVCTMLQNDPAKIKKFIGIFITCMDEDIPKLAKAIETGDADKVRMLAHTIKGSSVQIGSEAIRKLSMELENIGANDRLNEVGERLASMEALYVKVKSKLGDDT